MKINSQILHQTTKLNIENIQVQFPYSPSNQAITYMKTVISSLNSRTNVLLQSPKDTNKTLSLLCATLAWLDHQKTINTHAKIQIIYAAPNYSYLSNVVKILKQTVYRPNLIIIGSKQQYCIQDEILTNYLPSQIDQACKDSIKKGICEYYNPENFAYDSSNCFDIEQFTEYMKECKICPYYTSRSLQTQVDLVLVPFHYLISIWKNFKDIRNNIIIFDEGFNLQNDCEEGYSLSINISEINKILDQLEKFAEKLHLIQKDEIKNFKAEIQLFQQCLINDVASENDISPLWMQWFQHTKSPNYVDYEDYSESFREIIDSEEIQNWFRFITAVQSFTELDFNNYKVIVKKNQVKVNINFILQCLSPCVVFQRLVRKQAYNIIITGEALEPLNSWSQTIGIPLKIFNIQSACNLNKNVLSKIIVKSRKGTEFEFTQTNVQENPQIFPELGKFIQNMITVIPNGIIVIFSSFGLLQQAQKIWQTQQKMYQHYENYKNVFWEAENFDENKQIFDEYIIKAQTNKGALLFAQCNGYLNEIIELSDEKCRAIFMIGIPYLSRQDERAILKEQYLQFNTQYTFNQWYTEQAGRRINQTIGKLLSNKDDFGCLFLVDIRYQWGDMRSVLSSWAEQITSETLDSGELEREVNDFMKRHCEEGSEVIQKKMRLNYEGI